jgi:hypothetical protein
MFIVLSLFYESKADTEFKVPPSIVMRRIQRRVVRRKPTNVSEEHIASIFMVEK